VTGAGITIGIISTSFNAHGGAANDIGDGLLTPNITILNDVASTDEGRAMAQIIHAIAPGAAIDFFSGIAGPGGMAAGITALQNAGGQIIVDDVGFVGNDPVGGPLDQAIDAAVAAGVTYVTAAGNDRPPHGANAPIYGHSADPFAFTVAAMNF